MPPMRSPSSPLSWSLACDVFASWWSKGCFVVIHESMVVRGGGKLRMQTRCPQEIQCYFRLKKFFKAVDASLSRVWSFGLKPLTDISCWMLSYALTHSEADLDFMGTTLM
jgi:hypothetical protein